MNNKSHLIDPEDLETSNQDSWKPQEKFVYSLHLILIVAFELYSILKKNIRHSLFSSLKK